MQATSRRIALFLALIATVGAWLPSGAIAPVEATVAPIGWWAFEEGSGTSAADSASGGHTATLTGGASWDSAEPGEGGASLRLDGVDDQAVVAPSATLESAQLGLVAWIRVDPAATGQRTVAQYGDGCDDSWVLRLEGELLLLGHWAGTQHIDYGLIAPVLDDGAWHHVGMSIGTTKTLWVDGRGHHIGMGSPLAYRGTAGQRALSIGGRHDCGGGSFMGAIDDVRLYDRTLTADDVWPLIPSYETTTTLTPPVSSVPATEVITVVARVSPTPPGGAVVFSFRPASGDAIGRVQQVGEDGYATFTGTLPVGTYSVSASFAGQGPAGPSESDEQIDALAVVAIPTTLDLVAPRPAVPSLPITLEGYVARSDTGAWFNTTIDFYDTTDGGRTLLGSAPVGIPSSCHDACGERATFAVPGRDAGQYSFAAEFAGAPLLAPSSDSVAVTVAQAVPRVIVTPTPTTQRQHEPIVFGVAVIADLPLDTTVPPLGTITLRRLDTGAILASGPVTEIWERAVSTLPLGTTMIRAEYSGSVHATSAQSDPVAVTVTADSVDVTGVGTSYTTFYPYKDSYRDTVAINGTRNESASVAIRVYSPTGSLVRSVNLATGHGAYSSTWNGRNSAGTMLSSGRYKVVQTFTDTNGTKRSVTTYVTLSHKKVVYRTADLNVAGTSTAARGTSGSGKFVTLSGGTLRLSVPSSGWVGAGYRFILPEAVVYKSLNVAIYAKGSFAAGDGYSPRLGIQDYRACAYSSSGPWDEGCFRRWADIGSQPITTKWTSFNISPTYDRYGRTVRAMVTTRYGNVDVVKLRLRVTYGVLQ